MNEVLLWRLPGVTYENHVESQNSQNNFRICLEYFRNTIQPIRARRNARDINLICYILILYYVIDAKIICTDRILLACLYSTTYSFTRRSQ
jgi:hypothetical protein